MVKYLIIIEKNNQYMEQIQEGENLQDIISKLSSCDMLADGDKVSITLVKK